MRKKIVSILLALVLMMSAFCTVSSALTVNATSSNILIDGQKVDFQAYNIDGNNYFKLRDLAYALSGTDAQFEVTWNQKTQAINVIDGQSYTPVGGELVKKTVKNPKAVQTTSIIYLDGYAVPLRAYNIADNNYFKLREVAQVFDFSVEWDNEAQTIRVDTDRPYTAPPVTMTTAHVNSYPMLLIGQTKASIDEEFGMPTRGVNASYRYSNGLTLGFGISASEDAVDTDCCRYVSGSFSHLVNNCPSTLSLSQIKALFGNAKLDFNLMDEIYCVEIDWAGFKIIVDSDSNGNVKSNAFWFSNAANVPTELDAAYKGTWKFSNMSGGTGDKFELYISEAKDNYLHVQYIDYIHKYGPENVIGQDYGEMYFVTYDDGETYMVTWSDSWENWVKMVITKNSDGTLSFSSTMIEPCEYGYNFAFVGDWTLSK